ncbi:DUF4160 domain-containing protein [Adlercreutzia sp. ZJ473]|uniref:DUF4160 domain-containing protein n=1 Tax=Adlercreutzia sp. ZJ473 TaxID=2722822 RepID=UPI0035301DD5
MRGGQQHHEPHVHVRCGEHEASYALGGKRLAGHLPQGKERLLWAWMEIHRDELQASWELAASGRAPLKIDPLR